MGARRAHVLHAVVLAGQWVMGGCGVVPVHRGPGIPDPPTWRYDGPHGRPRAFGGDVCAVPSAHAHGYPPSPRAAFVEREGGWHDTRPRWPFSGPHPHVHRTCFREGWHLHLEPPVAGLVFDEARAGWRTQGP